MDDSPYKKEWDDKTVYMKAFWCLAIPPITPPPDWFAKRYLDIKEKNDKETLHTWELEAIKRFLDWGNDDK